MPTSTTTSTTNQYNPAGLNNYNMFQSSLGQLASLADNPFGNNNFQGQLAQMYNSVRQLGARSNSNALSNLRTGGGVLSNSGGLVSAMLNRNQLGTNMMQGNAFNSAVNNALQSRNIALASMQAYQPLQTGQTSQQTTGGMGTWLTPLLSAGLNMAMPGLGSMMGGGSFSAGYRMPSFGGGAGVPSSGSMAPSMPSNPWAAPAMPTPGGYA